MESSFPTIAAHLPLDWSSADPEQGLAQIEQAQELIYALHLERIVERLSKGWPAFLESIVVKKKSHGGSWDVQIAMSKPAPGGMDAGALVASTLAVDLVEANLPSDWVMNVLWAAGCRWAELCEPGSHPGAGASDHCRTGGPVARVVEPGSETT